MGKGRSRPAAPTEQTVVQSNLPKYFEPYAIDMIKRAETESKRDYTPYTGERLADESADLLGSRAKVRDIAASGIAGLGDAQSGTVAGMNRALQGLGFQAGEFDSEAAQKYMSPYMQNVVDVQKAQAILDAQRAAAGRGAQAVQAGAFGGSRQAVQDALAGEELSRQLAQIQATGQEKAFADAQLQFERDRAARAQAEQLGQAAGQNLTAQGQQLAALGEAARRGDIQAAELLEKVGKDIQAREQDGLDIAYQEFIKQRDFPREN